MKAIGSKGQKKYYKHVQENWVQPTCVQSSAHGGSTFVATNSGGGMDGAGYYWGSGAGSFNGSGGFGLYKHEGNMLAQLWCYVPEPIKVTSFKISIGDSFYQSKIYAANSWQGTSTLLYSSGWISGTNNISVSMSDYKQYFTFQFWYPADYSSTISSVKFNALTMPKLIEATEKDAEFSVDYSGVKSRYKDSKYYGL